MNIPTTGTYVDGWWGIYAPARAVIVAHELGAPMPTEALALANQELASSADNPNAGDPLTFEQHEIMAEHLTNAETWLNQHRTWPGRTAWGWTDGAWEHALSPDTDNPPAVRFWADIYTHDSDPTGPEDAIDSGYFDPNWSAWWPVTNADKRDYPRYELDLIELIDGNYHPTHLAGAAFDRALRWTRGTVDHIETTSTTVTIHGAETVDDLQGARGLPLASHWAIRQAHIVNLTPDEIDYIIHLLHTNP